jgi:PKD repeat protein
MAAMGRRLPAMLLSIVLCLLSLAVWGAEIVVSADGTGAFRSIQRAIDAARPGDTLLVNPGIYEEIVTLRSGLTIRGAGASHTILRSSYGYEPVLSGTNVSAVTIESIGIERGPSMLEAVVVSLSSAHVTFRNCRISGGQTGGVHAVGAGQLLFDSCQIEFNHGYGAQLADATDTVLQASRVSSNGSVGLHLAGARAVVYDSSIQKNAWDGLVMEGAAQLECGRTVVSDNGRWGARLLGSSRATFSDCTFNTQAFGNLRAEGLTSLTISKCAFTGGVDSALFLQGAAVCDISATHVREAGGDGIRVEEEAEVALERSTVSRCTGTGIKVTEDGHSQLRWTTVAYNGGHGLSFAGRGLEATHSIFALNGGAGLHSSASPDSITLEYNNVWGNRSGEYSGVRRSSSDVSVPPEFADPMSADLALTPMSGCIAAGAFGHTLGAGGNPLWSSSIGCGLAMTHAAGEWGAGSAGISWDIASTRLRDVYLEWEIEREWAHAAVSSMFTSLHRWRTQGSLRFAPLSSVPLARRTMSSSFEFHGVLDGAASRWQAIAALHIEGEADALSLTSAVERPTGLITTELDASWGPFLVSGRTTGLTVTGLSAGWGSDIDLGRNPAHIGVLVAVIPQPVLQVNARGTLSGGALQVAAHAYPRQWATAVLAASWEKAALRTDVRLHLREGGFEDLELRATIGGPTLTVSGLLGAHAQQGPRVRIDVVASTGSWFLPAPNLPPVPHVSFLPSEPEAGEPIRFDASLSTDPDGAIDQTWWDFGDGEAAVGEAVEHVYAAPGTYLLSLTISDDRGAITVWEEPLMVRAPHTRPVASFTWAPVSPDGTRIQRPVRAGDRILLDASSSRDPDGNLVEYNWDLQSDGAFDQSSSDPRIIIEPLATGTWPVTLRVVDEDGYSDAVMRVLVIEPLRPPEAMFDLSPANPALGDPVRFLDRSLPSDGVLLSWEWDFGDGHSSRDREPVHRYLSANEFEVRLTVRDSDGLSHTTKRLVSVQVNPSLVPIQEVWALVIGISAYAEVEHLSYARRDAEAMADWLISSGVPPTHIRLLTDEAGTYTTSEGTGLDMQVASLVNVREGLGWLRRMAGSDDLVLIHFSGHGYQGADDNLDEADGLDEFFILHDTRAGAKEDTALRDDEFGRFVDRMASRHVLIFFDSCYSGGLSRSLPSTTRATGDTTDVFNDFRMEGRLILSASTEDQEAFESDSLQHGVFSYFLLEGLAGAADLNADGHITIWELYGYVRDRVPPLVAAERGRNQIPQLVGEGETRVVLGKVLPAEAPPFSYCPAIPYAGATVSFRTETAYELGENAFTWAFGDGASAQGSVVSHVYAQPGAYVVRHAAHRDGTQSWGNEMTVHVRDAAAITAIIEPEGRVSLSVGRQNGVALSDRFSLASAVSEPVIESLGLLEVVELVDEDTALCRVVRPSPGFAIGKRVVPVFDPEKPTCFGAP